MSHGFHTDPSYDPMSKGLFFVEGEEWRVVRSKITPYFTPARIKGMLPMIHPIAETFVQNIVNLI
ncbi:hypothetical protein, partial [Klebsiella pneumoniae]|uniref:hypothetical protein n=1 Tax=Klebsiella pneumoniae TaxID=573 RepID=UPI0040553AB6